jgi:hypothetical protein
MLYVYGFEKKTLVNCLASWREGRIYQPLLMLNVYGFEKKQLIALLVGGGGSHSTAYLWHMSTELSPINIIQKTFKAMNRPSRITTLQMMSFFKIIKKFFFFLFLHFLFL